MSTVRRQVEDHRGPQDQVGPEIMDMFDTHRLQPDPIDRQTESLTWHGRFDSYRRIVIPSASNPTEHEAWALFSGTVELRWFLAPALYPSPLDEALQELEAIREEVEETCAVADDVRPIPESAYEDARLLLQRIHPEIPKPDIMWSEDGGIGLEWRPGDGIATMSLYGDNHVIYGAFFNKKREVEGICSLSDPLLQGFLTTLRNLFSSKA